jgi:hypothetical protein
VRLAPKKKGKKGKKGKNMGKGKDKKKNIEGTDEKNLKLLALL